LFELIDIELADRGVTFKRLLALDTSSAEVEYRSSTICSSNAEDLTDGAFI